MSENNDKPLVSIITVCYNSEKHIGDTIESVLNQTYENIEYIIVDAKSTDNTLDIIQDYEPKFNGRMCWISEPDDGIYDAMNKGVEMASGEIIGIINSDDFYHKKALSTLAKKYKSNIDIYYGDMYALKKIDNNLFIKLFRARSISEIKKGMINHPSTFVNKSWYNKHIYDRKYKISSDYKFILESYIDNAKFRYINFPFSYMRLGGISSKAFIKTSYEGYLIRSELLNDNIFNKIIFFKKLIYRFYNKFYNLLLPNSLIKKILLNNNWSIYDEGDIYSGKK